ncbi:two-component system sensor histidine kinase YesM [Anaerotaenia torta]|uniref:cache domain-containing sensor histidine kinase n=1 Tax=Anaerotaenia torta TaxID=433293 RepID=UPI003D254CE4
MKKKLVVIFILMVLLPTIGLGYSNYQQVTRSAHLNINQSTLQTLIQIRYIIENTLQIVKQSSDTLFFSSEVKAFIETENNDDLSLQLKQLKKLRNQIYTMEMDSRIFKIRFFVDGRKMAASEHVNFFPIERINDQEWYADIADQYGAVVWSEAYPVTDIAGEPDTWVVSCRRILKHSDNFFDNDGMLSVDVAETTLYSLFKDIHLRKSERVFIIDKNGYLISCLDKTQIGQPGIPKDILERMKEADQGIIKNSISDGNEYFIYTTMEETGWKIIDSIPEEFLLENYSYWGDLSYIIFSILILLLFVAASFIIINNITHEFSLRMNRIAERIEKEGIWLENESGEHEAKIKNHLAKVEDQVYHIIQRSNELVKENYNTRLEERKAQLMALQAQINPHFLYNTLECINWMAIRRDASDISSIITTLARYFRLTLNKGKIIVSIEDEIELAKTYLSIQNVRFDNAIRLKINKSPEIAKYCMPKLTLQPVIENAVIHGIMKKPEKAGNITIEAIILESEIHITIQDDGIGMDQDKVARLLEHQSEHYGLFNIQERIKLYYGDNSRICITSAPNAGTTVTIIIGKMEMAGK